MSLQQMLFAKRIVASGGGVLVAIQNETITRSPLGYAGYSIESTGTIIGYGNGVEGWSVSLGTWLQSGTNADYEVRYTKLSGNWGDGNYSLGVWRRTNISPEPQVYTFGSPVGSQQLQVELRAYGGDGTILDTAIITA